MDFSHFPERGNACNVPAKSATTNKSVPRPMENAPINAKPKNTDCVFAMKAKIVVSTGVVQGAAINPEEAPKINAPSASISFCAE